MKRLQKILISFAAITLLIFVLATLYFKLYWRDLLVSALRGGLKREVVISDIYFRPPLGLSAYKVDIKDLLKADAVMADLDWRSIFEKKLVVSNLVFVRPIININRTPIDSKPEVVTSQTSETNKVSSAAGTTTEVFIKKFFIEEGHVKYNNQAGDAPFQFELDEVRFRAEDFYWPIKPIHTKFVLTGRIAKSDSPLSQSKIEADGWLDWIKKDMEGTFKILEANQYAGLIANVKSTNDLVKVNGKFDMNNFPPPSNNPQAGTINEIVYGALSNSGVKIGATFSFETKMDDFRVSNITFSGNVVTRSK
jgi:hypothetical protein